MSNVSVSQSDFDFWEFVSCGRCQLPFNSSSSIATIPFWLTECGHIVCNNHLNADQSCTQCGSPGIQLVPLQREMDAPMSEWFRSVPMWMDGAAHAAKFQQETMASQIRYYRSRHQQQRVFIERLKRDAGELKKAIETLNVENSQLRQELGHGGYADRIHQPADVVNSNGKRPFIETHSYDHHEGQPTTTSSPRSVVTPLGPNRLTLPQGQAAPNLSSNRVDQASGSSRHTNASQQDLGSAAFQQRPATGFIEQYAYNPSSTQSFHPQQLTHTQAAPQTFKRTKPNQPPQRMQLQPDPVSHAHSHRAMPPPPTPARFKPSRMPAGSNIHSDQLPPPAQRQQRSMGPPPTPQRMRQQQHRSSQPAQTNVTNNNVAPSSARRFVTPMSTTTNRFLPTPPLGVPDQGRPGPPPPSTGNAPQRFLPSGYRAPSRAKLDLPGGGQRMPFVSNQGHG